MSYNVMPTFLQHIIHSSIASEALLLFVHEAFREGLDSVSYNPGYKFGSDAKQCYPPPIMLACFRVFHFPEWDYRGGEPFSRPMIN
jgi:hypothetical protein